MSRSIRCDYRDGQHFACEERISTDKVNVDLHGTALGRGWTFDAVGTNSLDLCPGHSPGTMAEDEAHRTSTWRNAIGTDSGNPFAYGWSCACGASAAGWASRAEARNEADTHHEWAITNGGSEAEPRFKKGKKP